MSKRKYKYTGNSSFESAYNDCKLVDESIIDDQSFQDSDTGLVLYYMDRILEALDKQVAKKTIKTVEHEIGYYSCPTCNKKIGTNIMSYLSNYCPYCGQKLDWNDIK